MARHGTRSMRLPIVLSSITIALSAALLVGWILVILKNVELTKQYAANTTLLVGGIISFVAIITVLVLFSVFLAREIREVRRQTSFIDSVTHELRSPLASIRLGLETLARSELGDQQREHLREMMLDDTERLSAFINDILEASRFEHGNVEREVREFALVELVQDSVAAVARRHHIDPAEIRVDVAPDIRLTTDPTALSVVFKNLLDNAVKYSDPPYDVEVSARARGQRYVVIAVKDGGVGIPRGELKRVFQRFYRVADPAVSSRRGTGLGLFVVSALVRSLRGKLEAASDGRGRGTTISVMLPIQRGQAGEARAVEQGAFG